MKLRIEKEFADKYTNETYTVGSEVEFEKTRAAELLADTRELVSAVKGGVQEDEKPTEDPKPVKKPAAKAKKK